MTEPTPVNGADKTPVKPSLKQKATQMAGAAKARLQEVKPEVRDAIDRAGLAGETALASARERVEPVTAFVKKHRRVLTAIAIAAGAGAAAYVAFRRNPLASRKTRAMVGNLAKAALASGVAEKAMDTAKDLGRSASKRLHQLEKLRAPEIRLSPRQTRKLEKQLSALKKAPKQAREALPF